MPNFERVMKSKGDLADFGEVFMPKEAMEPILARGVRNALTEWLTEIWAKDELEAVGLKPRARALFSGPPGIGKTTLGHHMAARLGLPMVAIRPDRIMTTYVSESARALGFLFDLASESEKCVLFFDEFESIAQKRMHTGHNATGEADHNNTVNVLLQRLDAYSGFVIAATNHSTAIDPAVWRRFDIQIHIDLPGQFEREQILKRYIAPFILPENSLKQLAEAMETSSPALMRQFCEAMKRNIIIGPMAEWNMQKEAVVERIIGAVQPHPDLGKPRLWSMGAKDLSIRWLPWPLERAAEAAAA